MTQSQDPANSESIFDGAATPGFITRQSLAQALQVIADSEPATRLRGAGNWVADLSMPVPPPPVAPLAAAPSVHPLTLQIQQVMDAVAGDPAATALATHALHVAFYTSLERLGGVSTANTVYDYVQNVIESRHNALAIEVNNARARNVSPQPGSLLQLHQPARVDTIGHVSGIHNLVDQLPRHFTVQGVQPGVANRNDDILPPLTTASLQQLRDVRDVRDVRDAIETQRRIDEFAHINAFGPGIGVGDGYAPAYYQHENLAAGHTGPDGNSADNGDLPLLNSDAFTARPHDLGLQQFTTGDGPTGPVVDQAADAAFERPQQVDHVPGVWAAVLEHGEPPAVEFSSAWALWSDLYDRFVTSDGPDGCRPCQPVERQLFASRTAAELWQPVLRSRLQLVAVQVLDPWYLIVADMFPLYAPAAIVRGIAGYHSRLWYVDGPVAYWRSTSELSHVAVPCLQFPTEAATTRVIEHIKSLSHCVIGLSVSREMCIPYDIRMSINHDWQFRRPASGSNATGRQPREITMYD